MQSSVIVRKVSAFRPVTAVFWYCIWRQTGARIERPFAARDGVYQKLADGVNEIFTTFKLFFERDFSGTFARCHCALQDTIGIDKSRKENPANSLKFRIVRSFA
jgi:hypothetical protein